MKKFILVLLCLSFTVNAQRSITAHSFQVTVRPALSAILNSFYQMISLFPDFPIEIIGLLEKVGELEEEKEELKAKCPKLINKSCLPIVNRIKSKLSILQSKSLEMLSRQKMSSSLQLTNISGTRLINEFQADLEQIKAELDNSALKVSAQVKNQIETYYVIKKLDQLETYLSLSVVEFIPNLYKNDFRHFYFNYVHPIQQQMGKPKNYEFFSKNINSLNFAINLLNMKLTKRNKKTPDGMAPYLALMHNRWNSILRYYF